MDAIQINDRVQGFQRMGLPSLDVLNDRVGERGNERWRNYRPIYVHQVGLILADGHDSGIERQDLIIEARPAGQMLAEISWDSKVFS